MTPQELDKKLDDVISDIQGTPFGNIMAQIGQDALVTIRERVINTGVDADGQAYSAYSSKPMLSGCKNFINKSACPAGSKAKRKTLNWVTLKKGDKNVRLYEIEGGYKEFRELNGRQTGHVDFSLSGRMWQNIKVVSKNDEHNAGVTRIAATTDEDKAKLAGNTERRTDILKLSVTEINQLSEDFGLRLTQIFRNHGL